MAGASLLTLLDDIASILDDVSILTKVAAKKTAGVLGDDLALNAQQVTGVNADRELPVVWAVFKGSLMNKAILVPAALAISALAPWLVTPLLMIGGLFLCFEGFEKLMHAMGFGHHGPAHGDASKPGASAEAIDHPALSARADPTAPLEREKIKGAVRTDFILSAEIIAITLGVVAASPLPTQVAVLSGIALAMTLGVYGLVAGIVKLDDAGLWLSRQDSSFSQALGRGIIAAAPWLMKTLSVVGTAAMFLVGGGILVHGVPAVAHAVEAMAATGSGAVGAVMAVLIPNLANAVVGIIAGGLVVAVVTIGRRLFGGGSTADGGQAGH